MELLSPEERYARNLWDGEKGKRLAADPEDEFTFFCGCCRNFHEFIGIFDEVFLFDVDVNTLNQQLDNRPEDDWGKQQGELELILRLHATEEDIPSSGIHIDAARPLASVVDEILRHIQG